MTFNNDFDTLASLARERQAEILRTSASAQQGRTPRGLILAGVLVAGVFALPAALAFLRVW